MHTIPVKLGNRSYPIRVKRGLLKNFPRLMASMNKGQQWVIVTQSSLAGEYSEQLVRSLQTDGFKVSLINIPNGEQAKTLAQIELLYDQLIEFKCDRSSTLIALGGGVVGDVTGFVAATFLRGIDYIQIPSTLLAMVDSSIGGKTGVNLPQGKNLVGAIHQPRAVVIDPLLLQSLHQREIVSGFAEIIKYGAIRDRFFFNDLAQNVQAYLSPEEGLPESAIVKSCMIKAEIVSRDEHEQGLRRILNFGHTVGHALEKTAGFGTLRHGEAVAYGMLCAGLISHKRGLLTADEWTQLQETIRRLPLPTLPNLDTQAILTTIRHDKKVRAGKLHFVLLNGLGQAKIVDDVESEDILNALEVL